MENDSNKTDSSSGDLLDGDINNPVLQSIVNLERDLIIQQQNMQKKIKDIKKIMDIQQTTIAYCEYLLSHGEIPKFQSSDSEYLESHVSPIGSPNYKYQNLSEDEFKNLPDSTVLSGSLRQHEDISHIIEMLTSLDSLKQEISQPSAKGYKNISPNSEILETMVEAPNRNLQSNSSPSSNRIQETGANTKSDTSFELQSLGEILEDNAESSGNSAGKGKEAANPKFRYKKGSRSNVPFCESMTEQTPVKHSKGAFDTSDTKALKQQSPKKEFIRISPSVKRKEPDSREQDNDKRQLDKKCSRTFPFSNVSGNRGDDDNLQIAKKLKFEDDGQASEQCLCLTSLILQKDQENPKFINKSQTDQCKSEQLILPSINGLSNTVLYISTSKESSLTDESENVPHSVIEESASTDEKEDVVLSERGESSFLFGSEDVTSSVVEH